MDCDVIIPYTEINSRWVQTSIESILNQVKVKCLIHVISDDGSQLTLPNADNIILYENDYRIGPYRSVNRIFNKLQTNYIAIQDSDDIALPNRIHHSLDCLTRENAEMFGAAMMQFISYESTDGLNDKELEENPIHKSGPHSWEISPNGVVINGTRVMTKALFHRMNGFAPYPMSSDCEFTTRCIKFGAKVAYSNEIVALRRLHGTSLSRSIQTGMESSLRQQIHKMLYRDFKRMEIEPQSAFGYLDIDLQSEKRTICKSKI